MKANFFQNNKPNFIFKYKDRKPRWTVFVMNNRKSWRDSSTLTPKSIKLQTDTGVLKGKLLWSISPLWGYWWIEGNYNDLSHLSVDTGVLKATTMIYLTSLWIPVYWRQLQWSISPICGYWCIEGNYHDLSYLLLSNFCPGIMTSSAYLSSSSSSSSLNFSYGHKMLRS